MDTIFTLPLAVIAAIQMLLSFLLLCPRAISLPLSQIISKLRRNTAVQSVFGTICLLLLGLFVTSFMEVVRGADKVQRGDLRIDLMGSIDYLRAQVSCVLCCLNLLLILLNPTLAEESRQLDSQIKNLGAMQRQVKGLQAEYERVTAKPAAGGASGSGGDSEAEALKLKVDRLIREKNEQQAAMDATVKAKAEAEAKVGAMLSQIKGFDKEYDRILEENKQLQRRLAQLDATQATAYQQTNKKDD